MASKRLGFLTVGLLTGALLLGTAGLAAAQDPTTTPTPSPTAVVPGGMMSGQLKQMAVIHNEMAKGRALDFSQMQALHAQHHPSR